MENINDGSNVESNKYIKIITSEKIKSNKEIHKIIEEPEINKIFKEELRMKRLKI
jgi:hypothetical protein